jgi:transcriptional regulator with XRE-family HTH domain
MGQVLGCLIGRNSLHLGVKSIGEYIGEKVRVARRSKIPEMTIEQLADKAILSRQTVGRIENGRQPKVSYVSLAKIANALEMSLDDLMGGYESLASCVAETPAKYELSKNEGKKKSASAENDAHPQYERIRKKTG